MATAAQSALSRLAELQARASEIESKFQQDLAELELGRSKELASLADEIDECSAALRSNGQQTVTSSLPPAVKKKVGRPAGSGKNVVQTAAKRRPGRPAGSGKKAVVQTAAKRRPGRPAGSVNKSKTDDSSVAAASAAVKGEMKCEDAILHVLGQSHNFWKKYVPDLPPKVAGLKVIELTKAMIDSGLWVTDSKNPEQQVSQRLGDLRESGKVVRGDQMRYCLKS